MIAVVAMIITTMLLVLIIAVVLFRQKKNDTEKSNDLQFSYHPHKYNGNAQRLLDRNYWEADMYKLAFGIDELSDNDLDKHDPGDYYEDDYLI